MKKEETEKTYHVEKLTDADIKKGNEIISRFTKTKRIGLNYHSNWSLIMPVIVRLHEKYVEVWINYKNCQIEWSDEDNSYEKCGVTGETKLQSIFNAVVRFLTWVEENEVDIDNPVYYD